MIRENLLGEDLLGERAWPSDTQRSWFISIPRFGYFKMVNVGKDTIHSAYRFSTKVIQSGPCPFIGKAYKTGPYQF